MISLNTAWKMKKNFIYHYMHETNLNCITYKYNKTHKCYKNKIKFEQKMKREKTFKFLLYTTIFNQIFVKKEIITHY